jgi:hypothetical protein
MSVVRERRDPLDDHLTPRHGPARVRSSDPLMHSEARKHVGVAPKAQMISCSASRCITESERGRAVQVHVNTEADGPRPGSFVVLYRTTQPDIAVQDTEPWADERRPLTFRPFPPTGSCDTAAV